jgi:hypothetical protein
MTVQIPPGYATFAVEHWLQNYLRPAVCVWGAKLDSPGLDPVEIANSWQSIYATRFAPGIDSNVTIRNTRVTIGQDGGDPIVGVATSTFAGTATRDSTAPALAVMLNLNTNLGGRRNRGRKFLPWAAADTSVSEQGAIQQSLVTEWNTRAAGFLTDQAANGRDVYILHGSGSTPTPAPTEVTSITTNPVIRTQRNRQSRF